MEYSDIEKKYLGESAEDKKEKKKKKSASYADIASKYGLKADVDQDYIDAFFSDASNFGLDTSSPIEFQYDAYSDLSERSNAINTWLISNIDTLDRDTYTRISESLRDVDFKLRSAYNDFKDKSQYVSTVDYSLFGKPEFGDITYEYVNNQTIKDKRLLGVGEDSARSFIKSDHLTYSADNKFDNDELSYEERGYDFLEADEIAIYNYYYNTAGADRAQEYLDSIEDILVKRKAEKEFEALEGETLKEVFFGTVAGFDQFTSGIENLGAFITGDKGHISSTQHVSGMVREDLADDGFKILGTSVGQIGYDILSTTSNMLPSMVVGAATGGLGGALTLGASSVGNAYAEMRSLGYDEWQSRGYAALVGASETTLQYLLGGISKLGGKVTGNAIGKFVSSLDNSLARVAIKLGGNMLSEGLEESLQTVIEPVFKSWATGEDIEAAKLEDILYSGLLGALSAGMLEGVSTVAGEAGANTRAKKLYGDGSAIVEEALGTATEGSELETLANKYKGKLDSGKSLSGAQIVHLDEAIANNDGTTIKKAVLRRLGELGESTDVTPIAEVLTKYAVGEKLTSKDYAVLNNSDVGHTVLSEMNEDNIKSGALGNKWAENIGTRRINPQTYNKAHNDAVSMALKQLEEDEKNAVNKELSEAQKSISDTVKVSEDGKTTYTEGNDSYAVDIRKIVSTDNGELKVELDNGKTVSTKSISFSSKEEGLMYEMVARMEASPETANELIKTLKPSNAGQAAQYFTAIPLAYKYGTINYEAGLKNINISDKAKKLAFNRGRIDATVNAKTNRGVAQGKTTKKGGIIYENGFVYDESKASEIQKVSMAHIEVIEKMSNLEVHIFESKLVGKKRVALIDGMEVSANGFFKDGNKIYIDINAGKAAEGAMLYTMAHEITHYIREWNAEGFKELGDFLISTYGEIGIDVTARIEKQKDLIKKRYTKEGKALPSDSKLFDMAYEELVAEAMSDMLADPKAYEKLSKLKQKNRTLWEKVGEAIKAILEKFKAALGIYKSSKLSVAREAYYVRGFSADAYNKLQDLYIKAFVKADANYEASIGTRNLNELAEAKNENGEPLFQYRAMEEDESAYREMLHKWGKMTGEQIDNLFATIDNAMELIKDNLEVLDYAWEADIDDRAFSPVKPNSDKLYQVSLDFSTLCRKRILQQTVQAQLQEALNKPLSREEGIAIRDALMALQEEGRQIEVACALCYVESARMKSPEQIKKFLNNREQVIKEFFAGKSGGNIKEKIKQAEANAKEQLHKENPNGIKGKDGKTMLDPRTASLKEMPKKYADVIRDAKRKAKESYKPTAEEQKLIEVAKGMTVADFTSPEGLESLAKKYPSLFDAYTSYIRNATKSKGIESDTWWRAGDSSKIGDVLIANMNKENGLRSQSWSDFQVIHILDYIASTIELATRNTKEQAYSKVPDYVELMGLTGVMINMSLIPTATFNGTLDYDNVEGIDYKRALELRDKYPNTAGTICIGVDNVQIKLLLADTTIDYVIPYHKSGMSKAIRKLMHIPTWSQYEEYQSEKNLSRDEAVKQAKKYGVKLLDASDPNYHKGTSFSEWFDIKEAQQIAKMENANPSDKAKQKQYGVMYGGYMAMQNAANNYLKLCAERGISPKFSHEKADFTVEDNYWKLLIDRKMVNNITGEVIEQQTIKPIFSETEIMRILNDELARYPKVKEDQDYATRKVTEKFLSGEVKGGMSAEAIAKVMKKPVDNVTNVNILASSEDTLYSERDASTDYLTEYAVQTALYDSLDHADKGDDNLIRISSMPRYIVNLLGIDGDFFIYRNHAYENMVSEEQALEENRFDRKANYHNLGIETMTEAILSLEHPIMTIATKSKNGNPTVIMLLPVFGKNNTPLYSVLSFYSNKPINGDLSRKPHIVLTIHERNFFEDGGRAGISDVVKSAIADGRVLDFDKKRREDLSVIAKSAGLGNITEASLKESLSHFRKFVNTFREENRIAYSERDSAEIANDFLAHIDNILQGRGSWYTSDVYQYIAEHPELNFIERIYAKDKTVKGELEAFLGGIDDIRTLERLSWFIGRTYSQKAPRWGSNGNMVYPYQGAVRTFRNAIKRRENAIMTAKVNGTDLELKNGVSSLEEVKGFFERLNSNEEIGKFAEKVFATAEKLGVNVRFVNQTFKKGVAGDAVGDMVEYKTSYFNDTAVSDQRKASVILHELIHSCTVYVLSANKTSGDVYYRNKTQNYENIANAATRLNRIFAEIQNDPDFKGEYGTTAPMEMVAELANERFVAKLKKKNLWESIVDWICELFGFKRGTSAYDNAMMCVDYILDNPEIDEYKAFAQGQRRAARREGMNVFGKTVDAEGQVLYSERDSYAPTFYSHMGDVIDGIKLEKMGANGVVPYLKGRGVKDEEIKWSGIEAFLEGKKSVTKAELQEFVAGSQLQIVEQMSGEDIDLRYDGSKRAYNLYDSDGNIIDTFTYNEFMDGYIAESDEEIYSNGYELEEALREEYGIASAPRWAQYKLDGGSNYRELVFQLPNSTYTNRAMRAHWGQDVEGVLAHARIQDMTTAEGKKMLFIEELQSDWHNEGREKGYTTKEYEEAVAVYDKLAEDYSNKRRAFNKYVRSGEFRSDPDEVSKKKFDWLRRKMDEAEKRMRDAERDIEALKEKGMGDVPDAPFRNTYHEYVLKRLLRMAAEEGYDSIGWTPSGIQSDRWSYEFAEAYRIEYDQEMPKFLRKYGKKWGATVGKTEIPSYEPNATFYDVNRQQEYSSFIEWQNEVERELKAQGADMRKLKYESDDSYWIAYDKVSGTEWDRAEIRRTSGSVWSMDITDSMKDSVLNEGQVLYSERVTDQETLDFLNGQIERGEYYTVYRSFQVIDGGLYAPMNSQDRDEDGKNRRLGYRSEIGKWEMATESRAIAQRYMDANPNAPYAKFNLDGGDNKTNGVAYNPYLHASNLVLNDQFSAAYRRNLVTVECRVPFSEAKGAYKADYAKDATGWAEWKAGVVAGELKKVKPDFERRLFLSRYMLPVRIIPDAEVARMYNEYLDGTNIPVPWNVVTPSLRKELEKAGVNISYKDVKQGNGVLKFADKFPEEASNVFYSERDTDAISDRTLLANALESIAKTDIEKNKLAQYKSKVALIESEQAKLTETRAKIKELSFAKGRRDTEAINKLRFEEKQTANRINTYDKQLLSLESTTALKNVLEREKAQLRKRLQQKEKEAIKKQKEKDAKTIRELMTRHTESRKKAIEGRHKTEMRHKIKNVVSDLNKLLLHPTKEQHVPIGLQRVVAEALDAVNMDTMNAEERVAYYNDLISKSSNPDEIATLKQKRDFFEYRDMNFKDRITALKNAYAEFKESDDPLIRNAHNDAIEDLIKNTADAVGNKSLKDMSYEQLESVYKMYKAVLATVRNSNKMFKEGRQETVTENSEAVKVEVKEVGGHKDRVLKLAKFFKKFGWNMLKPVTAMKAIGSKTFEALFNNVRAAEDTWAVDVREAKEFYEAVSKKYGYDKWDFKAQHSFKDSRGEEYSLSLEQMLSLYAYSKREQADEHLEFGGFIFDEAIEVTERKGKFGIPLKYEVNDTDPHRLGQIQMMEIIGKLTQEQRAFADEMQAYLSDVMGAKGNEVSLAMYDIKLYNEKNYFPLKTSRYYREFDPEKSGTPKIRNSGFSKNTKPNANNPIVLSNFMDVWASHVNDMSMYHAFVLPLEDFMRVYNYSSTAGGYDSVQQYIKNAYGSQANQYIERLMDDLNGGARVDSSADVMNKGIALFKKASVFASASVVIQQPSAIARAFAYINPKHFVTSAGSALNLKKHKSVWAEIKKYAPVAIIKEMGYFDTGMGRSTVEWIKGNKTFKDKMDDFLSKAPAIADELSWSYIWLAVKNEIKSTTNLAVGSEEFLKRCGERFTEIITNTQVYDSVLARSGMMRSKDTGMKMATAFMAEPTTTVNMMVDGILQGKRGNKKFTASTVGAISASIILNSILVALVYAARDDDEDETYAEKYIGSVTSELLDGFNPLTYVPFVKDIWSIAQGYDVERSDMSVVSNLWESIEGLFKEDKSGWEKVLDATGSVSSLFGIPLKNIVRDVRGMYNLTMTLTSGTKTTNAGISETVEDAFKSSIPLWDRLTETKNNADRLYEAIMSGDRTQIERVKARYKDEQAVESAMRQALREHDSRIHEAAQARYDGDMAEYTRIAKEIIAEGNFSQDIVVGAINSEMSAIKKGESVEEEPDKDEVESIYSTSDLNSAFNKGDTYIALKIIDDLINTKVANGKTEKEAKSSLRSSMTSYWKPLYKKAQQTGNASEMARIRKILYSSGLYGTANDVVKTTQNWLKD